MSNDKIKVVEAAKKTGVSAGQIYAWIKQGSVSPGKEDGVILVDLEQVEARAAKRILRTKAKPEKKRRKPVTKQADDLTKMAAVLRIYFPTGIAPRDYANVLFFIRALEQLL